MRQTRIFHNTPLANVDVIKLSDAAHHHLAVVLRAKLNYEVILFNGDGYEYSGTVTNLSKKSSEITLRNRSLNTNESLLDIHLGQCISANTRFDLALQKATELGVTHITPLISEHSHKLPKQQWQKRLSHWSQTAISAAEQSHRNKIPQINEPTLITEWTKDRTEAAKWLMSLHGKTVADQNANIESVAILVGPEGGFHSSEEELALKHGFTPVKFGPRVLRTETAAMQGVAMAQYFWGDAG